jgi:fucose permease
VAVVVGIEFCVVFFGALLLTQATGLTTAAAATAMSAFAVGELAGRLAGSRFTRRPDRGPRLLVAALAATAATFALLWLSRSPAVSVLALGLLGVSVANLYPLAFAQAVGAAADRADAAAARVQLLIGAAVIAGPLALGTLSDEVGVVSAFAVEPVLLALAVVLLVLGRRAADREAGAAATTPPRAGDGGFAGPVR